MDTPTYTAEEQAANRAKLVAALRSDEYAQGQHRLRSYDPSARCDCEKQRFCCLGVACDISELGEWNDSGGYVTIEGGAPAITHLPDIVRHWLGFKSDNGVLTESISTLMNDYSQTLTDVNDDGVGFKKIADLIEAGKVQTV